MPVWMPVQTLTMRLNHRDHACCHTRGNKRGPLRTLAHQHRRSRACYPSRRPSGCMITPGLLSITGAITWRQETGIHLVPSSVAVSGVDASRNKYTYKSPCIIHINHSIDFCQIGHCLVSQLVRHLFSLKPSGDVKKITNS